MEYEKIVLSIIASVMILSSCADSDMMNKSGATVDDNAEVKTEENTLNESLSDPNTTESSTNIITEKDSETEMTSSEVTSDETSEQLSPLEAAIKTVTDEVESKGWKNIEVLEGEPDSIERWGGSVIEPHVVEEGSVLYTVIGKSENQLYNNPFHVVVIVVFNEESNEWRKEEIYYISKSGRRMWDIHLKDTFPSEYESGGIVSADNEVLFHYMYAY